MRSKYALCVLALAGLMCCGCARRTMESSMVDTHGSPEAELDFWEAMEQSHAVTNNDALHGLLVLSDGVDPANDFEGRVAAAKAKGWLKKGWDSAANQTASVGMMSVAVCEIMQVRGGITLMVFGRSDAIAPAS